METIYLVAVVKFSLIEATKKLGKSKGLNKLNAL